MVILIFDLDQTFGDLPNLWFVDTIQRRVELL